MTCGIDPLAIDRRYMQGAVELLGDPPGYVFLSLLIIGK